MKKIIVSLSAIAIGLSGLSGCANMTETQKTTGTGAGIGAVTGAVIGAATAGGNKGKSAATGAAIGAAVGAGGGYARSSLRRPRRSVLEPGVGHQAIPCSTGNEASCLSSSRSGGLVLSGCAGAGSRIRGPRRPPHHGRDPQLGGLTRSMVGRPAARVSVRWSVALEDCTACTPRSGTASTCSMDHHATSR